MKRTVWLWELFGFAVTSLGGTLLHFLYDWLGGALWIAPFSGVNESTWEHMKLLFWPMLVFAFIQSFFFKDYDAYWCVKTRGILLGLALIPIIFYTYNGVVGTSPDWMNITIFFISAAAAYFYETKALYKEDLICRYPHVSIAILYTVAALFVIFTFSTPRINIFRDPLTGAFGI
jgi:hypothetical protein